MLFCSTTEITTIVFEYLYFNNQPKIHISFIKKPKKDHNRYLYNVETFIETLKHLYASTHILDFSCFNTLTEQCLT